MEKYISEERIQKRIVELAKEIDKEFSGENLIVISILKGSIMFCADLVRHIKTPFKLDFISAASYGDYTVSSGVVNVRLDLSQSIENENVLIIEDIIDTGKTLFEIMAILNYRKPKKIKLASLLYKPDRLIHPIKIDYLGFTIEDKFVVGYGLDHAGYYRGLPYIGIYQE